MRQCNKDSAADRRAIMKPPMGRFFAPPPWGCLSFTHPSSLGSSLCTTPHTGPSLTCLPPLLQHLFPVLAPCQGQLPAKTPIPSAAALSPPAKHLIKGDSCRRDLPACQPAVLDEWEAGRGKEQANLQLTALPIRGAALPCPVGEQLRPRSRRLEELLLPFFIHPQQRELADHRWWCSEEHKEKRTRKLNRLDIVSRPVRGVYTQDNLVVVYFSV